MATVYEINKGINRSIEFRGIKAQYIIYLAAGLVVLLLAFSILYVIGVNIYVCLAIVLPSGAGLYMGVSKFSREYGEHGLMKKAARRQLPTCIWSGSATIFYRLTEQGHEEKQKTGRPVSHLQSRT